MPVVLSKNIRDPWEELREPLPRPAPAPAQARGGGGGGGLLGGLFGGGGDDLPRLGLLGGEEGDFRDMLRRLGPAIMMLDPQARDAGLMMAQMQAGRGELREKRRGRNETMAWLQSEGVGAGEAKYLASNPNALNSWYSAWKTGQTPDWQIHELYDDKGRKQKFMIDMRSGKMQPLGGAGAPKVSIQTIYDENGQEQKVLFNEDTNQVVSNLGGPKTDVISPEAEEQKIRIAAAGKPESTTTITTKGEGKQAEVLGEGFAKDQIAIQASGANAPAAIGSIKLMRSALADPSFDTGGAAPFLLKAKQWAASLGWNPEGLTNMEMFNALSKQGALAALGGHLGTGFSEGDRRFIEDLVAGTGYTKGGNLALLEIQEKQQQRAKDIAKEARKYAKAHDGFLDLGWNETLANWAEAHPLFSDEDAKRITTLASTPDRTTTKVPPPEATEDWLEMPGMPGIRYKRGTVPPALVQPVVPAQPQAQPPLPPPPILPEVTQTQPRVRAVAPPFVEPNPLRFR
jgi:hypothetical protein